MLTTTTVRGALAHAAAHLVTLPSTMARPLTLLLVRHGQSEWNAAGLMQGQTPHVPLTDLGHAARPRPRPRSWPGSPPAR